MGPAKTIRPSLLHTLCKVANVQTPDSQKHLGLALDSKLDFN